MSRNQKVAIAGTTGFIDASGLSLMGYQQALQSCLEGAEARLGRDTHQSQKKRDQERDVRSIQRLQIVVGWSAQGLGREHFDWVARAIRPWPQTVAPVPGQISFGFNLFSLSVTLLELHRRVGVDLPGVQSYDITGGVLRASTRGSESRVGCLESRASRSPSYALVGLHGSCLRLSWLVYKYTQAILHRALTLRFGRWMAARPPL